MSGSFGEFIVRFELLHNDNEAVIYNCLARDGSGPLKTSFLTMLMPEYTIACARTAEAICSGAATVIMFRFIDPPYPTAKKLMQIIASFTNLNAVIFAYIYTVMCRLCCVSKLIKSSQTKACNPTLQLRVYFDGAKSCEHSDF